MNPNEVEIKVRLLGAKEEDYEGNKFYTLSIRLADQTVGDVTGVGTFDFAPFVDKDVSLILEMRKKMGRFGVRATSVKTASK